MEGNYKYYEKLLNCVHVASFIFAIVNLYVYNSEHLSPNYNKMCVCVCLQGFEGLVAVSWC